MKVYRVVDANGNVMFSNKNLFSGLYLTEIEAKRALTGMKSYSRNDTGALRVQESTAFSWFDEDE